MAFLDFIGARDKSAQLPSQTQSAPDAPGDKPTEAPTPLPPSGDPATVQNTSSVDPQSASGVIPAATGQSDSASRLAPERSAPRLSFPANFRLFRKSKSPLSPTTEEPGVTTAPAASTDQAKKEPLASSLSNADRRAKQSALVLRSLIVGQDTDQGGVSPQARITNTQLKSVKAQLLKPKSAARIIAQLRALPALTNSAASRASEPIQAVCLPYTDEEADQQYLSSLRNLKQLPPPPTTTRAAEAAATATSIISSPPVLGAAIESVIEAFRNLHVVNLLNAPDLGLGQAEDEPGLLAGALPTAETVMKGIVQITPQLMALGYATGKTIIPDHHGIYPPTDRISVLTYWWGMEVLLPTPTLAYLSRAQSISGTVINFLTALGVMYEGVREILPFVRYFSQYIDFEFNAIKAQDRGKGVVCASTWIMPAAIVPRPWDFADPPKTLDLHTPLPPSQTTPPATHDQPPSSGPVQDPPASPSPPVEAPAILEPGQTAAPAPHDHPSSSSPVQDPPASSPPPVEPPATTGPSPTAPPVLHDQPTSSSPVQGPPASSPPATHDMAPINPIFVPSSA